MNMYESVDTQRAFYDLLSEIFWKTHTHKQKKPSQTIQLKFEIHAQLLSPKWLKLRECVLGEGNCIANDLCWRLSPHVHRTCLARAQGPQGPGC